MYKKLAESIREYKKQSIQAPVFVSLEVIMECLIPFIIAKLINQINKGCGMPTILKYGGVLFIMACLSLTFGILAGNACATAACGFAKNLRYDLFEQVQKFSFTNIDKFSTPSLVTRMTTDINNVQLAYMMIIRGAIRCPFMLIFALIMSFIMGGKLAIVFAILVPFLGFGLFYIIHLAMPMFRRVFRKYDKINESIQENIKGMRVVKSFVREEHEKQKFGVAAEDVRKDFTRAERIVAFNGPLMQFCMYAVMIVVMLFGSYLVIHSRGLDLGVGQLSGMLTYGFQIFSSLMIVSMIFVMVTMANESAHRIYEVLEEESSIVSPENPVMEVKDGSVSFDHVDFKYSAHAAKNALSDINLKIKSGMTVGVLGGTGSSKSSLIQLISRLYDVTDGSVKVGGVDVKEYDLETLRNEVAVVLQKNVLFSGTIKDNLRWGNQDATDAEMIEACKLAQADEFIQTFPEGYDTFITQGGSNVSGGQKQRLCIARALLKKPKILILDDSTSAVDTKTDALIRKAFKEFIPDTTKIIIAQRVSSIEESDLIVILDGGKIVAQGTHDELLKSNAIYQEIYESQTKGGAEDENEK